MSARKVRLSASEHERTRRESVAWLRQHLRKRAILVLNVWSNRNGDKHDLVVISPGDGVYPMKITYQVAHALGWDLYDRDGRYVIRFGGGNVSPKDSLRQALGVKLYGDTHAIALA